MDISRRPTFSANANEDINSRKTRRDTYQGGHVEWEGQPPHHRLKCPHFSQAVCIRRVSGFDILLEAWQGGSGGSNPAAAYRRYVEHGLKAPPENPFKQAAHGWLLGGNGFVDRIRTEMQSPRFADEVPRVRPLGSVDVESVFAAVARHYKVAPKSLSIRGDGHIARAVAAWLARRLTTATLRELSVPLGLGRPESVSNLTRRIDRDLAKNPKLKEELRLIEARILRKTKNKV